MILELVVSVYVESKELRMMNIAKQFTQYRVNSNQIKYILGPARI
jgi:hypothetical protein